MNKVRFGIVGVGNMGVNHLRSLKKVERAELVAVCDINRQRADSVASEHGVKAFYAHRDLYASGLIDAVMIVTPHYAHTPLTIDAFDAGLHVLCDKPIAVHKRDAEKMLFAHRQHPELKFGVMFQMRTLPLNIRLKELLDSGDLGEVKRINWIVTDWFRTQGYYDSSPWRATWKGEGGGVLLNQCPHQLDLFQWFFGMPDRVRAFCAFGKKHRIEVEDEVVAYFEYASGKNAVFITSTGEAPGTNRLEIATENGRVIVEDGKINFRRTEKPVSELLQLNDMFPAIKTTDEEIAVPPGNLSPELIIAGLTDSIIDNKPLLAEGSEGIRSVELANVMLYSALCGETVNLPLDSVKFESRLHKLVEESSFEKKS